jgi:hypothetical protein
MPNPLKRYEIHYHLALRPIAGADGERVRKIINALGQDDTMTLDKALTVVFPDKSPKDALTAFQQLREKLSEVINARF